MDGIKTKGLVVRVVDYKDSDRIITLLTDTLGKISATMKGCRKAGAKLSYASVPMFFGEYMLSERAGRYIVTGCDSIEPFYIIREDYDKYCVGCAELQIAEKLTREGEDCSTILALTLRHLMTLTGQISPSKCMISYINDIAVEEGVCNGLARCKRCGCEVTRGFISMVAEGLLCDDCTTGLDYGRSVDSEVLEYVRSAIDSVDKSSLVSTAVIKKSLNFCRESAKYLLDIQSSALNDYISILN